MEKAPTPSDIRIYYEKNPFYRVIYADGLIGGVTPTGMVNFNFYATRPTIPKSTTHTINAERKVNPVGVTSEDSKLGLMREIEVGVYINMKTAKDIYEFLKKIVEAEPAK